MASSLTSISCYITHYILAVNHESVKKQGVKTTAYTAVVIGAGSAGNLALRALADSPRFSPVGVADLRAESLDAVRRQHPQVLTFTSSQEMLDSLRPDVVCIATYAPSHLPLTRLALERLTALKGIVVEKPLAPTTAEAHQLLSLVRSRSIPVAVPHGLLVAPHAVEILHRVHAEEIGALRLVEIRNSRWDIINAGIHWLNYFVALTRNEPIDTVLAACDTSTRTFRDGMQVETAATTYAVTRSGVRLVMNTGDEVNTGLADKGTVFHIVGEQGMIEFFGWEPRYRIVNAANPAGRLVEVTLDDTTSNHQRHFDRLAAQIDAGGDEPDYRVAESSLMALEICEAAYASHRWRCQAKLPLGAFAPPAIDPNWQPGQPYGGSGGGRDGRNL